jgi:hypothetical protein
VLSEVIWGFIILKACRFARGVPVVVAAVLLCLGVLLPLFVSGSEGSFALGMANALRVDQGANGNAPPQDGTPLFFAPAKEATDDSPVNAGLLTMLFLAASFFGLTARWLLSNAQGQGASCSSLGVVGGVVGGTREDRLPFLGVFRL